MKVTFDLFAALDAAPVVSVVNDDNGRSITTQSATLPDGRSYTRLSVTSAPTLSGPTILEGVGTSEENLNTYRSLAGDRVRFSVENIGGVDVVVRRDVVRPGRTSSIGFYSTETDAIVSALLA